MSEKDPEALAFSYHLNGQSFYPYSAAGSSVLPASASPLLGYSATQQHQQINSAPRYGGQLHYASKVGVPASTQMPHPLTQTLINSNIYQQQQQQMSMGTIAGNNVLNGVNGVTGLSTTLAGTLSHQRQLDQAQLSRQTISPHHHARLAVAISRSNGLNGANNIAPDGTPVLGNSTISLNGVTIQPTDKPSEWTAIDLGGMKLKNISMSLYQYNFLTTIYLSHNNLQSIPSGISKLTNLLVLDLSGNKLKTLPPELGLVTSLRELLLFDNQLTTLPPELGFLFQLETLGLEGNPLAEVILSMIQKDGTAAVITYLRDSCPVGPAPPEREWIILEDEQPAGSHPSDSMTLLCYNILCEKYATSQAYGYTPSWALAWDYRKELLMNEILLYSPDICCLQEVEWGQYEDFFRDQLLQHEYDSVFYPKSRARTMSEFERKSVDGCVTFFKTSKFTLVEKEVLEFQQIAMSKPEFRKSEEVLNRVMMKDNVAVVTLLENKETHSRILVANAHLHWDPQYKDVKLVQTAILVDELQKLVESYSNIPLSKAAQQQVQQLDLENVMKLPVILCGDFNSLPNSGVYEFLSNAVVANDHEDFMGYQYHALSWAGGPTSLQKGKNGENELMKKGSNSSMGNNNGNGARRGSVTSVVSSDDGTFTHRLQFKSAYSHINELELTNLTPNFRGVIDYIWYSTASIEISALLSGIDKEYVSKVVGFPNWHFPSDHIPLFISLRLRRGNTGAVNRTVKFK